MRNKLQDVINQASKEFSEKLATSIKAWLLTEVLGEAPSAPTVEKPKRKPGRPKGSKSAPKNELPTAYRYQRGADGVWDLIANDGKHSIIATRRRARDLSTVAKKRGYVIVKES